MRFKVVRSAEWVGWVLVRGTYRRLFSVYTGSRALLFKILEN